MNLKKIMKFLDYFLFGLMIVLLIGSASFLIKSKIDKSDVPTFMGYKMMVVLSGSMSPTFDPGAVVFVKETKTTELAKGDIITFKKDSNIFVTHRILKVSKQDGKPVFKTKGDNNNAADPDLVESSKVEGKVISWIPYIGYVFQFLKTPKGLLLLVVVPGLYIVFNELRKIVLAIKDLETKTKVGQSDEVK